MQRQHKDTLTLVITRNIQNTVPNAECCCFPSLIQYRSSHDRFPLDPLAPSVQFRGWHATVESHSRQTKPPAAQLLADTNR